MVTLTGSTDRWSVRAGEAIAFHIHSASGGFDAQLVRLLHGDENPAGPGFKEVPVESPVNGRHRGRSQRIAQGACAVAPLPPELAAGAPGWSLAAWVWPTLMDGRHGLIATGPRSSWARSPPLRPRAASTASWRGRACGGARSRWPSCSRPTTSPTAWSRPGLRPRRAHRRTEAGMAPRFAWVFEGIEGEIIGAGKSLVLGHGAAGFEVDAVDARLGTPAHTVVLASSLPLSDCYQFGVEETLATTPWSGGRDEPRLRADMTLTAYPNGGAVFAVGSILWCSTLCDQGDGSDTSRITLNVIRRFLADDGR